MELDSKDIYLRNNLENIMNGEWVSQFDELQLEMVRKNSFMLNHITIEHRCAIFEYNDQKIKYNFNCDPKDDLLDSFKEHMFSMIVNDKIFIAEYATFIRDWKIDKILK